MGCVEGDRGHPVLLGTSDIDVMIKSGKWNASDLRPGMDRIYLYVTVIIDYECYIQLYIKRGIETATETKLSYIKVL
ncbi:MAG: hypothetical protein MRK02_10085 [Candidatus Scalindua sp.]|nr:hypothetical protein [Candidatus Scalindua sp.]